MLAVIFSLIIGVVLVVVTVLCFSIWRKSEWNNYAGFIFLILGFIFLFCSQLDCYDLGKGHLRGISKLEAKMIYQVVGEMKVAGKEKIAIALSDARGKVLYVESDPLPNGTDFVKRLKDKDGNYRLEPVKLPAEPNNPSAKSNAKPVSKGTGFFLLKNLQYLL